MALRIRRSITLGEGVRLSGGARDARYSVSTSGRPRRRPSADPAREPRARATAPPAPNWSIPNKPSLRAPKHEREFFMGLEELKRDQPELALQRFETAADSDRRDRALSDDLLAGLTALHVRDAARAIPHLEAVVVSDTTLPDDLLTRYAPELAFALSITPEVGALIKAGSMAAAFALVECYQAVERREEAVGLLQQLIEIDADTALRVSLCELYAEAGDWDEILDLSEGVANEDDLTLQILLYRALALTELEEDGAALGVYGETLNSRRRSRELLKEAQYERGRTFLRLEDTASGREDLEAVRADDPEYRDVAELLEAGDSP